MNKDCAAQVAAKIGRALTNDEQAMVRDAIVSTQGRLMRQNPDNFRSLSHAEKTAQAAELASSEILHIAAKQKQIQTLDIVKRAQKVGGLKARLEGKRKGQKHGAKAMLDDMRQLEMNQDGLQQMYFGQGVLAAIEAIPGKAFGFLHDMKSQNEFINAIYGADGSPAIKAAVKAWTETAERMRVHANNLGADIGKLDYNYIPRIYDKVKMGTKAAESGEFVADLIGWMDKSRFLDESGRYIGDSRLAEIVEDARLNIVTDGLHGRVQEGKTSVGQGSIRTRHDASRVFHFKDAESEIAFMKKYGQGNILEAMKSHIHSLARDIAVLEHYGPKARQTFDQMNDIAALHDGGMEKNVGLIGVTPTKIFQSLSSGPKTVDNAKAEIWQGLRNIQSAAKLTGAVLSSLPDTVLLTGAAWYNGMPARQIANVFKDFVTADKNYKQHAARMGIIADSLISSVNRYAEGDAGYNITSKAADLTHRLGLLNAWTDGLKRAFSVNLHFTLGEMTRKSSWDALGRADKYRLEKGGITPEVYAIWQKSELDRWDKHNAALSPDNIMLLEDVPYADRVNAVSRLVGYVKGMENIAINTSDIIHKGRMGQFDRGDTAGEIWKSVMQFKSYPASLMSRQLDLIGDIYQSRGAVPAAAYTATILTGLTVAGAASIQAKQIVAGRDPIDMDEKKMRFWSRAMIQGGGLGFAGDLLYTGINAKRPADAAAKISGTLLGPIAGTGIEAFSLLAESIGKGADGVTEKEAKDTAARVIKLVGSNVPVAPMDLWYTRTAIDRLIVDDLQEWASPGWSGRMRGNIKKEYGQDFWWRPTETLPRRMPDAGSDGR